MSVCSSVSARGAGGFTPAEMVLVPPRFKAKIAELDLFPPKRLFIHRNFDPKVLIRTLHRRLPSALAKGRKALTPLVFLAAKGVGHKGSSRRLAEDKQQ